jgi:hypothetical protein
MAEPIKAFFLAINNGDIRPQVIESSRVPIKA